MAAVRPAVRVLVIHPRDLAAPTLGGIQTFLRDFVKFSPDDFEITFAGTTLDQGQRPIGRRTLVSIGGRSAWLLPLAPANGRVPRNPLRLLAMGSAQIRLHREMLRANTILQVHRPYRPLLLAGHRGPRVQFVHVDIRDWPGPLAWSRLRGMYREFSDRALEQMARVFVVNEPGVKILRDEHPQIADRIEFLPGWFDEAVFRRPTPTERATIRRALLTRLRLDERADADRLILFAGRLEPIKDPGLAVDAVAELLRANTHPARLLIAGDGTMRGAIEDRARQLGIEARTHLMGDLPREELALVMRACDVLLLTAQAEGGGPRVVLEALASGVPVVATPVGDVRRTVEHQVNGWIIEERTVPAVARGLRWVLDQPADLLSDAASAAVQASKAPSVLTHLYKTYRQLARNSAAHD